MHRHPSGFDRKYHEEFPPEARGRERPHHDMAEDDSLLGLMHRVMHGLHHSGEWFGGQERVLRLLSEEREVPQFILLDRMHIRPGSLSELVGKLEQKGLVERIQDVEDKRRIILRLTDKGKEAAVKESEKSKDPFAVLSEEEQEQLKTLLKKLLADNA